ncbi:transcription factor SPT20 homolog, partial [Paramuricea clavata]
MKITVLVLLIYYLYFRQSLLERLLDCFVDSVEGAPSDKRFRHGVHLLDKVVLQDNLSTLIVNFHPVNEGYSLKLKSPSGTESETIRLPYEETEFLDYLDAQQLPPMLVDLLEKSKANVFYNGCVIVEVRDYRCCVNPSSYDTSYVLLRPTCQTLVADVNALTCEGEWREEEKINLEAELLLKTQSPLCLDPSPEVFNVVNQMHFHKNKYRSTLLQRSHKRRFRAYISQNRSSLPAPSCLKLVDFLAHHKHAQPPVNLRLSKSSYSGVDTWKQRTLSLAPPTEPVQ